MKVALSPQKRKFGVSEGMRRMVSVTHPLIHMEVRMCIMCRVISTLRELGVEESEKNVQIMLKRLISESCMETEGEMVVVNTHNLDEASNVLGRVNEILAESSDPKAAIRGLRELSEKLKENPLEEEVTDQASEQEMVEQLVRSSFQALLRALVESYGLERWSNLQLREVKMEAPPFVSYEDVLVEAAKRICTPFHRAGLSIPEVAPLVLAGEWNILEEIVRDECPMSEWSARMGAEMEAIEDIRDKLDSTEISEEEKNRIFRENQDAFIEAVSKIHIEMVSQPFN